MAGWNELPGKVFVSHAFDDEGPTGLLLDILREQARQVEPLLWPLQEPDPLHAVSDGIVAKILSCDGLIYLEGGRSAESLWVNFERDYGRRSGRSVFAFDPDTRQLRRDDGSPVPLNVSLLISQGQEARAGALLEWMATERSFRFNGAPTRVRMKEIPELVAGILSDSAVALWLLDRRLAGVAHMAFDVPLDMLLENYSWMQRKGNMFYSERDLEDYPSWLAEHSMYARLTGDWELIREVDPDKQHFVLSEYPIERQFASGWGVNLLAEGSKDAFDWNRADDLIVRLTMMLQRARPFVTPADEEEDDENYDSEE